MIRLVEISGLNIHFAGERTVYAVDDLDLLLPRRLERLPPNMEAAASRFARCVLAETLPAASTT